MESVDVERRLACGGFILTAVNGASSVVGQRLMSRYLVMPV